jgi:hypothetical protein
MTQNSSNPGPRVDELCRIVAGELHSGPHTHPQAAQKEIDRLRQSNLTAQARKCKGGEWLAALEEGQGTMALYSDPYTNQQSARNAAQQALRIFKS